MVGAVFVCLYHIAQKGREVGGVGGRAELVCYDGDLFVRLGEAEHGLHEVVPVLAEDPRDAHDEIFLKRMPHRFFPFPFRLSVHIERMHRIIHFMGPVPIVAKDVVGADVDHLRVDLPAGFGDVRRTESIDSPASFRLVFRFVHLRIGGAVDDHVRAISSDVCKDGFFIGDVQIL